MYYKINNYYKMNGYYLKFIFKVLKEGAAPPGGEQGGALCGEHKGPEGRLACTWLIHGLIII